MNAKTKRRAAVRLRAAKRGFERRRRACRGPGCIPTKLGLLAAEAFGEAERSRNSVPRGISRSRWANEDGNARTRRIVNSDGNDSRLGARRVMGC
jgi:hypothetical protein